MTSLLKVACVQMNSGPEIAENLRAAEDFIREAAHKGANLIVTPEMTDSIRRYAKDKHADASNAPQQHFAALAKELGAWLMLGSAGVKIEGGKLANRSMLFAPDGTLKAYYDKIHMFDVTLSRSEFYKESSEYEAGWRAVIANCGDFNLGMGICYDLRFPHLWRDLAKNGAQILTAPAAFTVPTGEAHWQVLLRARAIETGSFVLAAGQVGEHEAGRKTYGHSMIIDPWGEVLAQKNEGSGIIFVDINLEKVQEARSRIPALRHDKEYRVEIL